MTKTILQRVGGECAVELRPPEDSAQGFEQGGRAQVDEQTQIVEARESAGRRSNRFIARAERRERAKQSLCGNLQIERAEERGRTEMGAQGLKLGEGAEPLVEEREARFVAGDQPVEPLVREFVHRDGLDRTRSRVRQVPGASGGDQRRIFHPARFGGRLRWMNDRERRVRVGAVPARKLRQRRSQDRNAGCDVRLVPRRREQAHVNSGDPTLSLAESRPTPPRQSRAPAQPRSGALAGRPGAARQRAGRWLRRGSSPARRA